jgi:hypothetical protein
MAAPTSWAKLLNILANGGPFSNRASVVNFFFVAFRVMVLFAVGIGRRSIWSGRKSAGAARSTTG